MPEARPPEGRGQSTNLVTEPTSLDRTDRRIEADRGHKLMQDRCLQSIAQNLNSPPATLPTLPEIGWHLSAASRAEEWT